MHSTIFEVIDSADKSGYALISTLPVEPTESPRTNKDLLREMLELSCYEFPQYTQRLSSVKKWVSDIDAKLQTQASGNIAIRLNLARFFLLPCIAPAAELTELRLFYEALKPFFTEWASQRPDVQLTNERDRHGRVFGQLTCRIKDSSGKMKQEPAATEHMRAMVAASPTLTHHMRQLALALGKMGPWSWAMIGEDQLFGSYQGPFYAWFRAEHDKKRAATSAVA